MDYYFDHLKKTVASAPSGGTEFGEKVKAYAEQNISATQEYVRELTYERTSIARFNSRVGASRSPRETARAETEVLQRAALPASAPNILRARICIVPAPIAVALGRAISTTNPLLSGAMQFALSSSQRPG
jgi:hypothetical protein